MGTALTSVTVKASSQKKIFTTDTFHPYILGGNMTEGGLNVFV